MTNRFINTWPIWIAVILAASSGYLLKFMDQVGFGLEHNRFSGITVVMRGTWFPFVNSKKGWGVINPFISRSNIRNEVLQFAKPILFFYQYPYINFARFENFEKFYKKAETAEISPFEKTISYSWGHVDVEKQEVAGRGHFTVVAREARLLITTDNLNALNDIVSITSEDASANRNE